jgi:hypothetical protein
MSEQLDHCAHCGDTINDSDEFTTILLEEEDGCVSGVVSYHVECMQLLVAEGKWQLDDR